MLETIIAFLNTRLVILDLFTEVRGLAELIERTVETDEGEISTVFPAEYDGNDEPKYLDDIAEFETGVCYHRQVGETTTEDGDGEAAVAGDVQIKKTFPMRMICFIPKDKLGTDQDNSFIVDKFITNVESVLGVSNDKTLSTALQVDYVEIRSVSSNSDKLAIFAEEFPEGIKFNVGHSIAFFTVDYTIVVEGLKQCIENYTCDAPVVPSFTATVIDGLNPESPISLKVGKQYTCNIMGGIVTDFTVDDETPTTGQTIVFTDTSTGSPTIWFWDFGDGNCSTDQNPTHEYFIPGTYTVKLISSNDIVGNLETKTDFITVSAIAAYSNLGFWFVAKHGIIREDFANTDINAIKASAIPNPIGNGSFVGMAAASSTAKPTLKVNAINGLPAVDFNGTDQYMRAAMNWGSFFDTNDHTIIMVMKVNSIGIDSASPFDNDGVLTEIGGNIGIHVQKPNKIYYYQFVSGGVKVEDTITLATYFVIVARKKSDPEQGVQINNRTEVTRTDTNIAIGGTSILLGRNFSSAYSDIEIAEIILAPANYLSNANISEIKALLYNRYNIIP